MTANFKKKFINLKRWTAATARQFIWRTGGGWWKLSVTRVRGKRLVSFFPWNPWKRMRRNCHRWGGFPATGRDIYLKKKEKTILPGVGVSFVLEGVSERKKIFCWKRTQDFWEKFSSNSSSSDERHVQVTRCVQGISDFEFFCRPRTRFFLGGLTLIDLIPKRSGPNTSLLQRD